MILNSSVLSFSTVDRRTGTDIHLPVRATHTDSSSNRPFRPGPHGLRLFQDQQTLPASLCCSSCTTATLENCWGTPRTARPIGPGPVNPASCSPPGRRRQLLHPPSKSHRDPVRSNLSERQLSKGSHFLCFQNFEGFLCIFFLYVCFITCT